MGQFEDCPFVWAIDLKRRIKTCSPSPTWLEAQMTILELYVLYSKMTWAQRTTFIWTTTSTSVNRRVLDTVAVGTAWEPNYFPTKDDHVYNEKFDLFIASYVYFRRSSWQSYSMPSSLTVRDASAILSFLLSNLTHTYSYFIIKDHSRLSKGTCL
jgi:hypothetical protein